MSKRDDLFERRMRAAELVKRGEFRAAIEALEEAIQLHANTVAARLDIAEAWRELGNVDRAIAYQEEALAMAPQHKIAHERLGMLALSRGDFSRPAWEHYLWHRALEVERESGIGAPAWDGSELSGKRIALIAHQGLGDQILFASCVPDVLARASQTTLFCDARLVPLFARSFAAAEVLDARLLSTRNGRVHFDFQAALARLPMYFRNQWSEFPGSAFLRADAQKRARWLGRLNSLGPGLKVGISWRGGNPETSGKRRSVPLAQWRALLATPGAHFVSLQYGDSTFELQQAAVHHWPEGIDDYDETAALVAGLDVVISVTTAVIHLAAALGKPTWVLVNARPQWRFLEHGARVPWYAAARLFRQRDGSQWDEVLQEVADELANLAKSEASA